MISGLTAEDREAVRCRLRRYVSLLRKARSGEDLTEDLAEEFERKLPEHVSLLTELRSRQAGYEVTCRARNEARDRMANCWQQQADAFHAYRSAAKAYLALDQGGIETLQLLTALRKLVAAHWSILH